MYMKMIQTIYLNFLLDTLDTVLLSVFVQKLKICLLSFVEDWSL